MSYSTLLQSATDKLKKWRDGLQEGDIIDVFEEKYSTWYTAKILARIGCTISIKYYGYSGKDGNAEMDIHDPMCSVSPALSKVKVPNMRWGGIKDPQAQWEFSRNLVPLHMQASWEATHPAPKEKEEEEATAPSTKHQDMLNAYIRAGGSKPSSRSSRGARAESASSERDSYEYDARAGMRSTKERKIKDVTQDGEDDNEWVCGVCKMLEAADGSALALCDGPCMQSFHTSCLGFPSAEDLPQVGGVWLCTDCETGVHQCFICEKRGKDLLEVNRCSQPRCGKYYHEACLKQDVAASAASSSERGVRKADGAAGNSDVMDAPDPHAGDPLYLRTEIKKVRRELPPVVENRVQNSLHGNNLTDLVCKVGDVGLDNPVIRAKFTEKQIVEAIAVTTPAARAQAMVDTFAFKCPHHQCRVCHEFYTGPLCKNEKSRNEKGELFECIACPVAFHANCIPPGTRFNSICLICNNHPNKSLPGREARTYKGAMGSILEQCILPEEPPNANDILDHHFRLPLHIRDDVNNSGAPLKYKVINRLGYDSLPKKGAELPVYSGHDGGVCHCKGSKCDDDCINRVLKFECGSSAQRRGGATEETEANGGNATEKSSNCCIGPSCGNRRFANKEWSPIVRFREHAMGFGCKATGDILDGSLIIEYIGEVINDEEMETRMRNQREFTPNDHDFYIMQLDNGLYVDGKHKGNDSRFINHSCDPNCELERWVVNGKMRIGIFAIRDIVKGEPLSYDYQFDTKEVAAFKCYCGTALCRGSMAPRDKSQRTVKDLSNSQRKTLIKQGQARENKSEADLRIEEWSRSYTSRTLPGDPIRSVVEGPHKASLAFACHVVNNDCGVFLARNIENTSSSDWGKRRSHMWSLAAEEAAMYMQQGGAAKRRK